MMDLGYVLRSIGGWHVGCQNHSENRKAVECALAQGDVTFRLHYAPMIPEGQLAFELTDSGLVELRRLRGDAWACDALKVRDWYRHNAVRARVA